MTSYELLNSHWPRALAAAERSFWRPRELERPWNSGESDAGLLLAGLNRFKEHWQSIHEHRGCSCRDLDNAAAAEIDYQWKRGRTFKRAAAALIVCIQCITVERPEKVFSFQQRRETKHENARPNSRGLSESDRRGHDPLQPYMPMLQNNFGATNQTRRN